MAPAPSPEPSSRWIPAASTTWQWQLKGTLNLSYSVDAYDVDLFDTPASTIAQLHSSGRKVICYFSAGSSEDWRDDYASFKAADMGNALDGWPGERWLDISSANVRSIMAARLDLAQSKGCDGVEPDNVDGYTNSTGLALTAQQQLDYNRFLATQAHARNLAIGLKNDVDQLATLAPDFDFAVNEQCHEYDECDGYSAFTQANKPVFVDRDSVVKYKLSDIGIERRTGYKWLGTWPKNFLEQEYAEWKAAVAAGTPWR